jgi:hypothetical protein
MFFSYLNTLPPFKSTGALPLPKILWMDGWMDGWMDANMK